jgi:hypothetical protein
MAATIAAVLSHLLGENASLIIQEQPKRIFFRSYLYGGCAGDNIPVDEKQTTKLWLSGGGGISEAKYSPGR